MRVIDIILKEGTAATASERVLKSILGHAGWSAAQKVTFKESVDLCTDAIEQMMLRGVDLKSPEATRTAWEAIKPRLAGSPWASDREFIQEIFTVSKAEAEERVANKAAALHPKEEPKPTEEPKPDDGKKPKVPWKDLSKWGKYDKILKWTFWGANGAAVAQAVAEYNEQRALAEKIAKGEPINGQVIKWTPEQMDQFARVQHVKLVTALAPLVAIPVTMKLFVGTIRLLGSGIQKFLPSVNNWLIGSIVKPLEKFLSIAQRDLRPNSAAWSKKMKEYMERGYTAEQATKILELISKNHEKVNRTFDTVATAFAAEFANPQKIYTSPQGDEFSLMELIMIAALEIPIFSPFMSSASEVIFNVVTKIWNNAGGQWITGWEATTLNTDLQRAAGTAGPAQQSSGNKQQQQAPAATPAPQKKKTADGVEVINWD